MARQRSPNYPTVALSAALDSARKYYGKAQRTPVHPEEAQRAMGYSNPSGASRSRLAALRQYGLLEDLKGDLVRISDLGLQLLHPQGDDEYQAALAQAATTPPLFKELWETHRTADPSLIASHLIRTRHFSAAGARNAADSFRATMSIVKASPAGYSSPDDRRDQDDEVLDTAPGRQQGGGRVPIFEVNAKTGAGAVAFDLKVTAESGRKIKRSELERLVTYVTGSLNELLDSEYVETSSDASPVSDVQAALNRAIERQSA